MAQETPPDDKKQETPSDDKKVGIAFFRSRISGLSVQVGPPVPGEVANQEVRFSPFMEKFQGDDVRVGYLMTDNPVAIEKCRNDYNVEEITENEYSDATNLKKGARPAAR